MQVGRPIEPMLAATVDDFPAGSALAYEPKWDGFRAQVHVLADGWVELFSRALKPMTGAFPETAAAIGALVPPGTVLDGELVHWAAGGQLDFSVLQQRLAARGRRAHQLARRYPVTLVAFDVLHTPHDGDLWGRPLAERRQVLEQLLVAAPADGRVLLTPQTQDKEGKPGCGWRCSSAKASRACWSHG